MASAASKKRVIFRKRRGSAEELTLMRQIAREFHSLGVTEIARAICELLEWKRPHGGLKNHECRQLLERLRDQGWLALPEVRRLGPRGPRRVRLSTASAEQPELTGTAGQYEPLRLIVVEGASADSRLWMELIQRYHYLGYRVPVGAQLPYLVRSAGAGEAVLARLQWTSAAWKMAARDRWIGWGKILARCARQLPADWQRRYGHRPLLLETLVDGQRFVGTRYRAANWIAGRNARAGPDGPLPPSGWLRPQAGLGLSSLPQRSATAAGGFPAALLWT